MDDFIPLALCDVKGCHQPQCGQPVEVLTTAYPGLTRDHKLMVRVRPCQPHYGLFLEFGAHTVGRAGA